MVGLLGGLRDELRIEVTQTLSQENFVNTPACFVNTFSLEFARGRAASHPSPAYIIGNAEAFPMLCVRYAR